MTTTVVANIGTLVLGPADAAPIADTSLVIEDGLVAAIGGDAARPDRVIDAAGLTVLPGLVDGHVHPTFGEWTPAQNSIGWITNYLHGGTTTMVSAGELHVPGLPFDELTPSLVTALAVTAKETTGRLRPSGMKASVGTVLLVPGMSEARFDELAEAGIGHLKFIFYDWSRLGDGEAQQYVKWAHERGMVVKMHSGGVSRSGSSRVAGHEVVTAVAPDVIAHISGGPIPMPDDEIRAVIDDLPGSAVEVCSSMNYRATMVATEHLTRTGALDRLVLGTDTPGGTGVIPRGMMRNICFLASVCGLDPVSAVAAATCNTARTHNVNAGVLTPGHPADLVICGPIQGSTATNALDSFALGDLPGISVILVDGEPAVAPRSTQTPPPRTLASIRTF
ncbi:MAG TPA: amidohydrolase family protein [Streptosporangiaceae bacterium]